MQTQAEWGPWMGPWHRVLGWGPAVGPWVGAVRWGPGMEPCGGALGWRPVMGIWDGDLRWGPGMGTCGGALGWGPEVGPCDGDLGQGPAGSAGCGDTSWCQRSRGGLTLLKGRWAQAVARWLLQLPEGDRSATPEAQPLPGPNHLSRSGRARAAECPRTCFPHPAPTPVAGPAQVPSTLEISRHQ